MLNKYFLFICSYDHYIGFDDIDVEIFEPKTITINKMEEIISLKDSDKIIIFILESCKLNKFETNQIRKLLGN